MSQGTFEETLIRLEYLYFVQNSTFFQGISPRFLVKNDQIVKSVFFHSFMSLGSLPYRKTPSGT